MSQAATKARRKGRATGVAPMARAEQSPRVYIGTSGWDYGDWSQAFYASGVRESERLTYYAERFPTLELNVTFYRDPTPAMLRAWNERLPADYRLAVKGSRRVTHHHVLAGGDDGLDGFLDRVAQLNTLRVLLWQLPPRLAKDLPLLEAFLARLAARPVIARAGGDRVRHAVEFRHASWWDDAVADLLARHDAAFVAISHPSLPDTILPTTDTLYVRFHGRGKQLYVYDYADAELAAWVERLGRHLAQRTLYAYFNNTYHARATHNARRLQELFAAA